MKVTMGDRLAPLTPPKTPQPDEQQKPGGRPNRIGLKQRCAEARATIEAFQALKWINISEQTFELVKAALQHVKTNQQELEQLIKEEETRQIDQHRVKSTQAEGGLSYASVAAANQAQRYAPLVGPGGKKTLITAPEAPQQKKLDTRKMRQITIRVNSEEEFQAASSLSQVDLMKFINKNYKTTEEIVAAHIRAPKDIILAASSMEAREKLEVLAHWASAAFPSAKVLRQTFQVAVQGAPIGLVNEEDQEEGLKKIADDNVRRNLNVKILSFAWPKHASRPKRDGSRKEASTLVLDVATPEEVNRLPPLAKTPRSAENVGRNTIRGTITPRGLLENGVRTAMGHTSPSTGTAQSGRIRNADAEEQQEEEGERGSRIEKGTRSTIPATGPRIFGNTAKYSAAGKREEGTGGPNQSNADPSILNDPAANKDPESDNTPYPRGDENRASATHAWQTAKKPVGRPPKAAERGLQSITGCFTRQSTPITSQGAGTVDEATMIADAKALAAQLIEEESDGIQPDDVEMWNVPAGAEELD
ncbi:MAG: hypothetical protein Q9228_005741 [Teloschistes exilis]